MKLDIPALNATDKFASPGVIEVIVGAVEKTKGVKTDDSAHVLEPTELLALTRNV